MNKILTNIVKIVFPFALGTGILWWMYRGFPFSTVSETFQSIRWDWMLLSLLFGILPQVFRGLRWRLALEPLDEHPSTHNCINAIFLSYASSLVVPRVGEITRCGTLKRYSGTSFSKALGTVVTERVIDSLLVLVVTALTLLFQLPVFLNFMSTTGTDITGLCMRFTSTGYIVTAICTFCMVALGVFLVWRLSVFGRVKEMMINLWAGIMSLKNTKKPFLYVLYTLGIWVGYFLHFYLTFLCFDFTEDISLMAGLVVFCVGSIAVIVPTPNGAGPWHFAVKTILVLYGVSETNAVVFALLVHTIQTALLIVLGIYSLVVFAMAKKKVKTINQ